MRSNCIVWATAEFSRLVNAGERAYLMFRPSDEPGVPIHALVGVHDPVTDQAAMRSFKPLRDKASLLRDALWFEGAVVSGDKPRRAGQAA